MKDDVQAPPRPPKKRRALERALGRHLAIWASDESLSASERERVQAERDRRKAAKPPKVIGVLVGDAGATPEQTDTLARVLTSLAPTEVHHPFCSPRIHQVCRATGAKVVALRGEMGETSRRVARASDALVGLVPGRAMPVTKDGLWGELRRAKDRGANVVVIWQDGTEQTGRW
jgi:hypothetical protein